MSTENMKVKMKNRLAGVGPLIDDDPEAAIKKSLAAGNLVRQSEQLRGKARVFRINVTNTTKMTAGNHE
jgi:hypothetical protein